VDGLHETDKIAALGKHFDLHPLLIEDVLNTRHRPKAEEYDEYLFLTLKMLDIKEEDKTIISEQVSFVLGKNWVISFQEKKGDVFGVLRQRLRENKGFTRQRGADYLLYRLLDMVVDNYFFVTEYLSEAAEDLEEKVLATPNTESLQEIQYLKKQLVHFRKAAKPLREAVALLIRDNNDLIEASSIPYLRDVYEHIIQVSDVVDTQREMLASIMDLYLSGVSNKMNQVMQILTTTATIFIPLTFIAGVYGMNFDNMPELHWKYGYFGIWVIMIAVIVLMVFYFKRKKWI